jgi:glycosyltransferase involved in cell wall biosynthesis
MKIGMLSADWGDYQTSSPGGCTWIRFFGPAAEMQKLGIEVFIGEFGWVDGEGFVVVPTYDRILQREGYRGPIKNPTNYIGNLDVVIFKLWMWHQANDYIKRAQDLGQTIIIDIDDWFHGLPTTNIAFQTTHPDRDALWNRNHMLGTYRNVNGLITSTKFLNDFYSKFNDNCYQVYNSIKPSMFVKRYDAARNKPVVGWVGIMVWRSGDIEELRGWLGPFLEKYDLKFHHAGINPEKPHEFAEIANINPERLQGTNGCSPQYYGNILLPMDIAIVPLNSLPFNEAKSNLKGLEYAMSGIPFVAYASEDYKKLAADGAGSVAKKPRDWIKNMEKLIDPDERKRQADRGYEVVSTKYNVENVVHLWIETIEKIVKANPKARVKIG